MSASGSSSDLSFAFNSPGKANVLAPGGEVCREKVETIDGIESEVPELPPPQGSRTDGKTSAPAGWLVGSNPKGMKMVFVFFFFSSFAMLNMKPERTILVDEKT